VLHTTISSVGLMIWKALQDSGVAADEVFTKAGLDPALLRDPVARYPFAGMTRLWNLAVETTGDPCFGLKAIQFWHPTTLHALGFAWFASANLKEGFERIVRYMRVVGTAAVARLEHMGGEFRFYLQLQPDAPRPAPAAIDATAAMIVGMCRASFAPTFVPRYVWIAHPRSACTEKLEAYFKAPIEYDAEQVGILIGEREATAALPTSSPELAHANEKVILDYLARLDRTRVAPQLKAKLVDALPSGTPEVEHLASALNMSLRSLQRKLQEEGTSYNTLLDETRRELAACYIDDRQLSISEISYLLGFSEPANFTRAFRRWTGKAPSSFREQRYANAG